jgi:hypothetical protein
MKYRCVRCADPAHSALRARGHSYCAFTKSLLFFLYTHMHVYLLLPFRVCVMVSAPSSHAHQTHASFMTGVDFWIKLEFGIWNAHGSQRMKTIFDFLFKKSIYDRPHASENFHNKFSFADNF